MRTIKPIEDLKWYYQDSPAALGHRGVDYERFMSASTPTITGPTPAAYTMDAAKRQRRIQRVLQRLDARHRSVLELAYFDPPGAAWKRDIDFGSSGEQRVASEYSIAGAVHARMVAACSGAMKNAVALVERLKREEVSLANEDAAARERVAHALSEARKAKTVLKEREKRLTDEAIGLVQLAHDAYKMADKVARAERASESRARKDALRKEVRHLAAEFGGSKDSLVRDLVAVLRDAM